MINGYSVLRGEQYIMHDSYECLNLYIHDSFITRCLDVLLQPGQRFGYDKIATAFGFRFEFRYLGYENMKELLNELMQAGVPYDAYASGGRYGESKISSHLRFTSEGSKEHSVQVKMPGHKVPSMLNQEYYSKLFLTRQLIAA